MSDLSQILDSYDAGDPHAAEKLLPLVYSALRELAAARLAHEKPGQTLQATALVHEAYLRLVSRPKDADDQEAQRWNGREHFFAAAAEAMRRILVDRARRKNTVKHGGEAARVDLDPDLVAIPEVHEDLLALDAALDRLAVEYPQQAEVVKLKYFAGLSLAEVAEALDISERTAGRHWAFARAWLRRAIQSMEREL